MTQLNNHLMKYIFLFICFFIPTFSVLALDTTLPEEDLFKSATLGTTQGDTLGQNPTSVPGESLYQTANLQPTTPTATPKLSITGLMSWIIGLINYVIQFILVLSLVAFLWGIFKLVFLDASNEAERAKAKKFMLWGIVALFVMVSVWGLVNVLKSSVFGGGSLIIPQLK